MCVWRLHACSGSGVSRAKSRQTLRPGRCLWHYRGLLMIILSLGHIDWAFAGAEASAAAHRASSNPHSTSTDTPPATAAAQQGTVHHGRSLKQLGYDPYGIGYYDPYQAGVTPGFVNVDLNRETGLHVDVGTVAVDISADKNYYGLGIGNLLGIGAAKDRGWNLQVGGGNIVDVSVTKDAGLGLWLLNGLANIQIGPDGRGWETGHIAAQSVPGSAAAAAAAPGQQVTQVVVDDPAAGTMTAAAAADGEVHVASDTAAAAAAAVEEPIITEEPINPQLTAAAAAGADGSQQAQLAQSAAARSSAARRSRPRTYVEPRPAVYVQPRPATLTADDAATAWSGNGQYVSGAAAPPLDAAQPATAAAVAAAAAAAEAALPALPPEVVAEPVLAAPQPLPAAAAAAAVGAAPAAVGTAAAAAPRRACEGGELVAVAGNKFKCKYRKGSRPAAVRAQPTGFASRQ